MAADFTPGPWHVSGKQSIRGLQGEYIARANWQNGPANARLIAAAPDMYAVCDALERAIGIVDLEDAVALARAALAKARGEA